MSLTTIDGLGQFLASIGLTYCRLGHPAIGQALVVREGARILALAPAGGEENVLWSHPELSGCRNAADLAGLLGGGMGGLRLWQAPERAFMWNGAADPVTFCNYSVQPAMDPGQYQLNEVSATRCVLADTIVLRDLQSGQSIKFSVRRIIELSPLSAPSSSDTSRGVTIRLQHQLRLLEAPHAAMTVDLWHLLQLPAGTLVGAGVRAGAMPVPYFNAEQIGPIENDDGLLLWATDGQRKGKIALRVGDVTGGPYAVRQDGDRLHGFRWNVSGWRGARYVDGPPGESADDHLLQFWDGFGFCEAEYHTPGVSLERPEVLDTSELSYLEEAAAGRSPREFLRMLLS
jgi:hypothetical protein